MGRMREMWVERMTQENSLECGKIEKRDGWHEMEKGGICAEVYISFWFL